MRQTTLEEHCSLMLLMLRRACACAVVECLQLQPLHNGKACRTDSQTSLSVERASGSLDEIGHFFSSVVLMWSFWPTTTINAATPHIRRWVDILPDSDYVANTAFVFSGGFVFCILSPSPWKGQICPFLLVCFKVRIPKISDKTDSFLLNYSNLFGGPLFIRTRGVS